GLRPRARDDPIDVGLDVDARVILEFALALRLGREGVMKLLAELRSHHLVHVRKGDHRCVARNELEFFGAAALSGRPCGESHVVRHQPGAEADSEHHQRNNDEIAGPRGHESSLMLLIRTADRYCSSTYSRCSTARPALHRVPAMMPARHTMLVKTVGTSWKSCSTMLTAESCGISWVTSACR